jgi:hypothetical protein
MIRHLRPSLARTTIVPFETAIAVLSLISGIAGIAQFGISDPIFSLIPHWEADLFFLMYTFSGLGMLVGITLDSGMIESFGLWFLSGAVIARFILYANYLGVNANFIVTGAFDAVILAAAFMRMRYIRSKHLLVKVSDGSDTIDGLL